MLAATPDLPSYEQQDVPGGVPVKLWTRGVPVEDEARRQLANAARLPVAFHHVAAMPDVHYGIGATVGSVIATRRAVIPAAVGVDIGCSCDIVLKPTTVATTVHASRVSSSPSLG